MKFLFKNSQAYLKATRVILSL